MDPALGPLDLLDAPPVARGVAVVLVWCGYLLLRWAWRPSPAKKALEVEVADLKGRNADLRAELAKAAKALAKTEAQATARRVALVRLERQTAVLHRFAREGGDTAAADEIALYLNAISDLRLIEGDGPGPGPSNGPTGNGHAVG